MNKLKLKRGFSLVELMVVVAIMGTLAAIAIPAYNEYRKSAKKTAYKSDMLSLHKGWMAFGVELDSYCERETLPRQASISNVGMQSLLSSKLYGESNGTVIECEQTGASCAAASSISFQVGTACAGTIGTGCTWANNGSVTTYGPGKDNFIGFATDAIALGTSTPCPVSDIPARQHKQAASTDDTDCKLNVEAYQMGVGGHIAGADYYSATVNNNGVVKDRQGDTSTIFTVGGICS